MSEQQNWFEDEDEGFEEIPTGTYPATLTNATLDETKEFPRFSIEFTLESKRKAWMNLGMKPTQKKFTNWMLREMNVYDRAKEISVERVMSPAHAILEALGEVIGEKAEIEITYREWQGKRYMGVKVESFGSFSGTSAGGRTSAKPPVKTAAQAPARTTSEPPSFDANEEIPF